MRLEFINFKGVKKEDIVFAIKDILIGEYLSTSYEPVEDYLYEGIAVLTAISMKDKQVIKILNQNKYSMTVNYMYALYNNLIYIKISHDTITKELFICIRICDEKMRMNHTYVDLIITNSQRIDLIDIIMKSMAAFKHNDIIYDIIMPKFKRLH